MRSTTPGGAEIAATSARPNLGEATKPRVNAKLERPGRRRVIDAATAILEKDYFDRHNAKKMAAALRAHEKNGDDDAVTDGRAFAALLTQQMREVSPDRHLTLDYSEAPLAQHPIGPTPEDLAGYRKAMKNQNCTFEGVAI